MVGVLRLTPYLLLVETRNWRSGRTLNGLFDVERGYTAKVPSALGIRRAAIRFAHLVRGFGDFSATSLRRRALTKGIAKNHWTRREIPFNTDLHRRMANAMGDKEEGGRMS